MLMAKAYERKDSDMSFQGFKICTELTCDFFYYFFNQLIPLKIVSRWSFYNYAYFLFACMVNISCICAFENKIFPKRNSCQVLVTGGCTLRPERVLLFYMQ